MSSSPSQCVFKLSLWAWVSLATPSGRFLGAVLMRECSKMTSSFSFDNSFVLTSVAFCLQVDGKTQAWIRVLQLFARASAPP
eukprot:1768761-Amphidinium_carterae.1